MLVKRPKRSLLLKTALLLVAAVGLSSCRHTDVHDALLRAEALMETDPQQARAVLAEIEDSILKIEDYPAEEAGQKTRKNFPFSIFNFQSKGEAAYYALLKTQADYKCRVRLTSDSLILLATNYYGTKRKTQRAALAQYYLGCTYSDMNRDLDAIDALLRATTLFPDTTNKYYAYSQRDLGELLLQHERKMESLEAFRHYRFSDICRSDSVNVGWADWYMGKACLYLERSEQAESYFLSVIANPYLSKELHANARFQLAKLNAYLKDDYANARYYLEQFIAGYKQKENIGAAYHIKADILLHENELDSAFYYYKKVLTCKQDTRTYCETYKKLTELSLALNQTDSSDVYFQQYMAFADSVNQIRRDKEISDIENNHVVELHDRELASHRSRFLWTWGFLLAFFVLAAGIVLLLLDRKRKGERLKYETELRDIKQRYLTQAVRKEEPAAEGAPLIPSDNEEPAASSLALQEERKLLYQRQYEASEWARFFKKHQPDIKAKQFVTVADAEQFEWYLSGLFVDMLVDMVKENPDLTDEDTLHCAMTLLGFKPSQIAYCSRTSSASCYTRRSRMKPKLTPEWYQFIFGKAAE